MMKRFSLRPPYTDGSVSPARAATSTRVTGQGAAAGGAALASSAAAAAATSASATLTGPSALAHAGQALGRLQLAPRLVDAARLPEELAQQVVRGLVVGVVVDGAPQHPLRRRQVALALVGLAQQDVGPAEERVQPHRLLQRADGFVPLRLAHVGIAQAVEGHG